MSQENKHRLKNDRSHGFTLVELMVVLGIFGLLLSVILANYAGLRGARNLKIAQSELVSNLRKIQSYTLSSRALNSTQAVQYYILKFDSATPDRYTIQALYNVSSAPQLATNIETIMLPQEIRLSAASPFQIDRPPIGGSADNYDTPPFAASCLLVAYKLPFGRIIFNNGCNPNNPASDPYSLVDTDDYSKIKNFVADTPSNSYTASDNTILTFTLTTTDGKLSKTVTVNGITGAVTFSP